MPRQGTFAAADVENFIPRPNQFGDACEFGPGDAGKAQGPMKVSAPIKVQVKSRVALQHWIEEGKPAWGFPQAEMIDSAELPVCRNPKRPPPQSPYQPPTDRLNAAYRRQARNRARGSGLHRLAEIAAGDDDVTRIVAGRLGGRCERRFRRRPGLTLAGKVAQSIEARGHILEPVGDDMDDAFLALQFAGAAQESGAERGAAEAFEDGGPDDQIGDAGLVLDGDEDDTVGAARTLPDQDDPGDRELPVDRQMGELGGGDQAFAAEFAA